MRILSEMIELAGGEFNMGQEDGPENERPVHRVNVPPFALSPWQVTNAEYDLFVRATGKPAPEYRFRDGFSQPAHPVVAVNWFDAVAFCAWASRLSARRFRLPAEAEWEYAARGGLDGCRYPWGNTPPCEREAFAARWLRGPEAVGSAAPNAFGLFDMCENVREWCSDWFDPRYYRSSPRDNPKGPASGAQRVARGGSWRMHVKISRCAARAGMSPAFRHADFGFRVACDLP
jgi:formylglycine-generating enzyme required for sulfatase activity